MSKRHSALSCPVVITVVAKFDQISWGSWRGELEVGVIGNAGLFGYVAVRDVANYFFSQIGCGERRLRMTGFRLGECDVDDRGLAAEFGVYDLKQGWPYLSSPEKVKVECNCVRLVLGG